MEIVEVKQKGWNKELLRVDIALGNKCNYKCWYCWPGSNEGTIKYPNYKLIINNLSHLLDYYLTNTEKKKIDFHIMGGEITHWKNFLPFVQHFKNNYDCIFTLTTNASKKLEWWKEAYQYLDYINISVHNEYSDPFHIKEVADFLYEKNVYVVTMVLMDPFHWDKCMQNVKILSSSKHRWTIKCMEIIDQKINYTDEQKQLLKKERYRRSNIFYFFRTNKSYKSKVKIVEDNGKTHNVNDNHIMLKRLNNFKDWECNVGVDWIAVKADGSVSGICGNGLYKDRIIYNIHDKDFKDKFKPLITPTICSIKSCWCMFETNMPKRRIHV